MLCFKWVWFGWSTCLVCWCGTVSLLKFVGGDIKQLGTPATEQRTSKQLWNAPINLNTSVDPSWLIRRAHANLVIASLNALIMLSVEVEPGWCFHIAIHIYIVRHISTHADNIHEFRSRRSSRSRRVKFGCAPSAVRASCSGCLTCQRVRRRMCVCVCLRVHPLWISVMLPR